MKKYQFLLLAFFALSFLACENNDDDSISPDSELSYDGENATGPLLAAGYYEAAARFNASVTSEFTGRQLTDVTWFMGIEPASCMVKVYGQGTTDSPGTLLYEQEVTNSLQVPAWNSHRLATPIDITGEDIWISIAFTHLSQQQSIGCDDGPRNPNGDFLFRDSNNQWSTYQAITGESVNWNIRGQLSE